VLLPTLTHAADDCLTLLVEQLGYVVSHPLCQAVRQAALEACMIVRGPVLPALLRQPIADPWPLLANVALVAGRIDPTSRALNPYPVRR
jgi:hypothetical protein